MKKLLLPYVGILLLYSAVLLGQDAGKIRLLITDVNDGRVTTIDTILPSGANVDLALQKMGYDQSSIAKASAGGKRQITIATEEMIEMPSQFNREGMPFNTTEGTVTLDISPKVTDESQLKIEDIVKIPPGATVEDMPDGGKRILTTEKDAFGNTYTKQTIVRMGSANRCLMAVIPVIGYKWTEKAYLRPPNRSGGTRKLTSTLLRNTPMYRLPLPIAICLICQP
ncbi:hypothetical protein C7N43_34005 [Sphingobacteriales bacterium UPWRP_1]|nr:hypothetical protein C7N43_34005 [Sphingobacteriales bacterium UPWRP_1]